MDSTLKKLLQLVRTGDVETRCAALLLLTRMGVSEDAVVRAVEEALTAKNIVVRDFAIGYLEQIRPAKALPLLLPLLDSEEEAVRARSVAILGHYGAPAVTAARGLLKDAPRRRVQAIIQLCAAHRSAPALNVLFELLENDEFEIHRAACDAIVSAVPQMEARARAHIFERAEKLVTTAKGRRTILVAAAKLFGALGDAKARRLLHGMLDAREPHVVRTHALGALTHCLRGEKASAVEIDTLLGLLDSDDEAGILRPAIQILEPQALDRSLLKRLNELAESQQPVVKRFAVQKLGAFDSGAVVKTLIGYLTDDSFARREQAKTSLKQLAAARTALVKEFVGCDEERKAWTLAEVLLAHDRSWKKDVLQALRARLQKTLEGRPDRLYSAYFNFLNTIDPEGLVAQVRERAEALRKKKSFAGAARWLSLLRETPAFDDEVRFSWAVAELKAHPRSMTGGARRHDPALDTLRELSRTAFPLGERLRKDRSLEPDDLFYVGFQFADGDREQRGIAAELLEVVAAKNPRTKTGKAARNKLRLLEGALA